LTVQRDSVDSVRGAVYERTKVGLRLLEFFFDLLAVGDVVSDGKHAWIPIYRHARGGNSPITDFACFGSETKLLPPGLALSFHHIECCFVRFLFHPKIQLGGRLSQHFLDGVASKTHKAFIHFEISAVWETPQ